MKCSSFNGKLHYRGRAVDQPGQVLDILVTARRDKQAAQRLFRQVLKRCRYGPRVIITDKLARDGAAQRERDRGSSTARTKG